MKILREGTIGPLFVPLVWVLSVSCAKPNGDGTGAVAAAGPTPAPTPGIVVHKVEPTLLSIQTDFVDKKCVGCHSKETERNRFVNLHDISKVVEIKGQPQTPGSMRTNLIKPGCPQQSLFLSVIKTGEMPPRGEEKIDDQTIKAIEAWILNLDSNAAKSCNGDEPSD